MRRSNLQRGAADVLAAAIAAAVPALAVHAIPEDWNTVATYPALAIVPQRSTLTPWQQDELDDTIAGQLLVEVGTFEATFSLRLLAPLAAQREDLEQQVLEVFFQDEDRPGVLLGTINNIAVDAAGAVVATVYNAPVAYALDSDEWREEMVFTDKRESFLEVAVQYPLVVMRKPQASMDQILLAMTHDLSSNNPSIDETVQVNQDGSIARV